MSRPEICRIAAEPADYQRYGIARGEIAAWEPPSRLAYLWHIRDDRADATEVEINFVDQGDATTRVEIEHRGWERLGSRGPGWRDVNLGGWNGVLPHYRAACSRARLLQGGA